MTKEERIVYHASKGRGAAYIAKQLRVSRGTIYKVLRAAGVPVRGKGRPGCETKSPEKAARFREAYGIPGTTITAASRRAEIAYHVGRTLAHKIRNKKIIIPIANAAEVS